MCWHLVSASPYCALMSSAGPTTSIVGPQEAPESSSGSNASHVVATAWYAGWHSTDYPLANVSWNKYSSLIYAFAFVIALPFSLYCWINIYSRATTPDVTVVSLEDSDEELLPQFVDMAHQHVRIFRSFSDSIFTLKYPRTWMPFSQWAAGPDHSTSRLHWPHLRTGHHSYRQFWALWKSTI